MATTGAAHRDGPAFGRLPLLLPGIIALVTGLHGGLQRLGWEPPGAYDLSFVHGPLMVAGFFGTLISLERAVALQSLWTYAAPLAAGLGALSLLAGLAPATGAALFVLGAIGLLAGSVVVVVRQPSLHAGTMAAGAGCWLIGALVWLGASEPLPTGGITRAPMSASACPIAVVMLDGARAPAAMFSRAAMSWCASDTSPFPCAGLPRIESSWVLV